MTILEDALSVLPTVGVALGFENPWHMNEQQMEEFEKKLFELRPQVRVLANGDNAQGAAFASGEAWAGLVGGPYVAGHLKKEGQNLAVKNEAEPGTAVWVDNYSITKEGGASSPAKLASTWGRLCLARISSNGIVPLAMAKPVKETGLRHLSLRSDHQI